MHGEPQACVILTTCESDRDARGLARALVSQRLAACVQRLPIQSTYCWEGELREGDEVLLLVKTARDQYERVAAFLAEHHPYDEPEVVMLPIDTGSRGYLDWIRQSVG